MDVMKVFKRGGILLGVVVALLGVVFLIWPKQVVILIDWVVGIGFLLAGITNIMKVIQDKEGGKKFLRILPGIAFVLLAFYVLIFPIGATYMLGVLIGIFAIAAAFDKFANASVAKKAGESTGVHIFMGIINILFGVMMFYSSFIMISFMIVFIGAYLVVFGIMMLVSAIKMKDIK